ncbi:MAG: peptide chain release factor N(5)-glutamine methyltransferase [Proteobacteria bacterium]|nr:peptide chain release factor N(5)-glutamine methyltransferase [Pseudomonadota bacterium]
MLEVILAKIKNHNIGDKLFFTFARRAKGLCYNRVFYIGIRDMLKGWLTQPFFIAKMINQQYFKELYLHSNLDKREIELLLCHVLQTNTAGLFIFEKTISPLQRQKIAKYIKHRENGKPLAYIAGYKAFWDLELKVNKHTLIPRPETEQIVELLINYTDVNFSGNILDLGTGTGAIALSIAKERCKANVIAVDVAKECVRVAKYNQQKNKIANVHIIHSNWFEKIDKKFDFIVSNPPYIAEHDEHLQHLKYEPITALTAKKNGLADIEYIIQHANKYLKHTGQLIIEHGYDQSSAVQTLYKNNNYSKILTHKDFAGIARITSAIYESC